MGKEEEGNKMQPERVISTQPRKNIHLWLILGNKVSS